MEVPHEENGAHVSGAEPARPPSGEHGHRKKRREFSAEETKAFWKRKKEEKKLRRRESRTEVRNAQQQDWMKLTDSEKEAIRQRALVAHEARRAQEALAEAQCATNLASTSTPTIVFDLGFVGVMKDGDSRSTMSQLKYSYSVLRRSGFSMKPAITSFDAGHRIFGSLTTFEGFKRFPPPMHSGACADVFQEAQANGKLVYLTPDTDNVLQTLDAGSVYVVGAFVDHNTKKGLTRDAALAQGIRMARLPLDESIAVGNRCKVLTINHVVEVLVRFLATNDWAQAFQVLPTRRVNEKAQRTSSTHSTKSEDANSSDGGDEDDGDDGHDDDHHQS